MAVTALTLITLSAKIIDVSIQVYNLVEKSAPQLTILWEKYKILADRFLRGEEITEEDVTKLEEEIKVLSDQNAALEDSIINGTVS